ncbi:hypothetical protein [Lentibacillus halodurans]|uniref:hypothetical protein n=1 Tax=Lentibacillus halodurans TaxID=237679 RepID=UPI001FCD1A9D|nr:hypothetical protein [Lentibacillus halodurans]
MVNQLNPGDEVKFNLDYANPKDDNAAVVLSGNNGFKLCYIPVYSAVLCLKQLKTIVHIPLKLKKSIRMRFHKEKLTFL